jgi:hypothetical protein
MCMGAACFRDCHGKLARRVFCLPIQSRSSPAIARLQSIHEPAVALTDTITPVTTAITRLITTGTTERNLVDTIAAELRQLISTGATQRELIAVVAYLADLFSDLTPPVLSQAFQVATTEAERNVVRKY